MLEQFIREVEELRRIKAAAIKVWEYGYGPTAPAGLQTAWLNLGDALGAVTFTPPEEETDGG